LTLFRVSAIVVGMPSRAASTRYASAKRRSVLLVLALRLLVLLFAVELSGLSHAVLDAYSAVSGDMHADSDCDDEQGGHECPPGCPSCHCWHAGTPSLPLRMEPGRRIVMLLSAQLGFIPGVAMPLPGADPDSIYRPPRA
jgi:hypothetical protein